MAVYGGPEITTSGLVLYLDAANKKSYPGTGTTWNDLSGRGNSCSLTNGPSYSSVRNGSIILDGTDDWGLFTAGSDFAYGTGNFTIECWFRDTSLISVPYSVLYSQTVIGTNYFLLGVEVVNGEGKVSWIATSLGGGTAIRSSNSYNRNIWNHAAVSRISGSVTVYLNGIAGTPTNNTTDFTNTTYIPTLGDETHHGGNNSWKGNISILRIYKDKGLTSAEVLNNYNALKGRYASYLTDPDAITYVAAVEAADGQELERSVALAYQSFIVGCKADNIWSAIKASCILIGARTLAGALTPLKPLGAELWNPSTPSITNSGGSVGSWQPSGLTMSNAGIGTNVGYPRFSFSLPLSAGKSYAVSGRLTGDVAAVTTIRLAVTGFASNVSYNSATGVFSGAVVNASASLIEFGLNATLGNVSVSIAELSIKETSAPTNVNFVAADYNRKTGLIGDGSTKYLASNRAGNADPQNDSHVSIFIHTSDNRENVSYFRTNLKIAVCVGSTTSSAINFTSLDSHANPASLSLFGLSRSDSSGYTRRLNGASASVSDTSVLPSSLATDFYRRTDTNSQYSAARLAFYSIGSAIDLAKLDTRVSALYTAIGAAIP